MEVTEDKISLWKPIEFGEQWREISKETDTAERIKRAVLSLKESGDFSKWQQEQDRRQAIETGVIEGLYSVSRGITETFIKHGFKAAYIAHNDTNIDDELLIEYLKDAYAAMNFVRDMVARKVMGGSEFSVGFIKQLHALVTKSQKTAAGRDMYGNRVSIPLEHGVFKIRENNPVRDGVQYLYCPPMQVDSEMDNLVGTVKRLDKSENTLVLAAWVHHAFTQIHPFQDGNGRVARLLASFILIRDGLFPLVVDRTDRAEYIDALELADNGEPAAFVNVIKQLQLNLLPTDM